MVVVETECKGIPEYYHVLEDSTPSIKLWRKLIDLLFQVACPSDGGHHGQPYICNEQRVYSHMEHEHVHLQCEEGEESMFGFA